MRASQTPVSSPSTLSRRTRWEHLGIDSALPHCATRSSGSPSLDSCADPRRPGNRARAGLRENLSGALEPLLQVLHVPGHLPLRLAPHDERHEQLAEPVPLEVGLDRRARPRPVIERLDWPFRIALTGPSMPRAAQLLGGLKLVVSIVLVCSRRPSRRTMTTFDPTARGPPSSARELTRLSCHSSSRDKSGFVRRSRRESGSIFRGTWAARTDPIR
jgi:hypothetical protein